MENAIIFMDHPATTRLRVLVVEKEFYIGPILIKKGEEFWQIQTPVGLPRFKRGKDLPDYIDINGYAGLVYGNCFKTKTSYES